MYRLKRILMWPIFILVLNPLISRNYKLREKGLLPDEWYWADKLATKYNFYNCKFLGFL